MFANDVVVLDPGTASMKAGFAGNDSPTVCSIRFVVGFTSNRVFFPQSLGIPGTQWPWCITTPRIGKCSLFPFSHFVLVCLATMLKHAEVC